MNRKSFLLAALVVAGVMVAALPAFSSGQAEGSKSINLYSSGSDNVRIQWEALIAAFEKTNPGFSVKQQYLASGTGTRTDLTKIIAAWNSGQKEIDVDIMADTDDSQLTQIKTQASLDALLTLDPAKIPNWQAVQLKSVVAPTKALVYRGTAVYIAYNSDMVPNPPKTEAELHAWIKANPGRFAYNDPGTGGSGSSFVLTTVYNRLPAEAISSPDEKWMAQWGPGLQVLAGLHPSLYKASGRVQYPVKNQGSLDLLASGEIWMCPAWADMVLDQKSRGLLPASIKLAQIDPPLTGNATSCVVPAMSQNPDEAQQFLNFVVSVEGQDILVNVMKAIPVIDTNRLPKATVDLLSGLEIRYRTSTVGALGTQLNERWTKEIATLQ